MGDVLLKVLLLVLGVNVMLFIGQASILDTNPDAGNIFQCEGSILGQFEAEGCNTPGSYILNITEDASILPSGETSVDPETGNIFTDAFTGIKTWMLESLGLGYILNLLSAPYSILSILNLPEAFVFAVGTMWYAFTLIVIVSYLFGRSS